jgi:hypothetical protein
LRALVFLLLLMGCPAAHSPYPDKSCMTNTDCFQGETCLIGESGGTCVGGNSDGGTP